MMGNRPDWVYQARRSVGYFPSSERSHPAVGNHVAWMFVQDIQLGSLRARRDDEYAVSLDPPDAKLEQEILNVFGEFETRWRGSLHDAVSEFVDQLIAHLAYDGEAWYELIRPVQGAPAGSPRMVLLPVPPGRMITLANRVIQVIPRVSWREVGKRLNILPRSDLWHVAIPKELGGAKGHRHLLHSLALASLPAPEFSLDDMRHGKTTKGYDFSLFRTRTDSAVAAFTKRWGWPGRGSWNERWLEYMIVYRNLLFARSKAVLRVHIIAELNNLLEREGITSRLMVTGLPDPTSYEASIAALSEGKLSFKEAIDAAFR